MGVSERIVDGQTHPIEPPLPPLHERRSSAGSNAKSTRKEHGPHLSEHYVSRPPAEPNYGNDILDALTLEGAWKADALSSGPTRKPSRTGRGGAAPRSVPQTRKGAVPPRLDIRDFRAKFDGKTDDTVAWQTFCDAVTRTEPASRKKGR